jgi:hypothetical protein
VIDKQANPNAYRLAGGITWRPYRKQSAKARQHDYLTDVWLDEGTIESMIEELCEHNPACLRPVWKGLLLRCFSRQVVGGQISIFTVDL